MDDTMRANCERTGLERWTSAVGESMPYSRWLSVRWRLRAGPAPVVNVAAAVAGDGGDPVAPPVVSKRGRLGLPRPGMMPVAASGEERRASAR